MRFSIGVLQMNNSVRDVNGFLSFAITIDVPEPKRFQPEPVHAVSCDDSPAPIKAEPAIVEPVIVAIAPVQKSEPTPAPTTKPTPMPAPKRELKPRRFTTTTLRAFLENASVHVADKTLGEGQKLEAVCRLAHDLIIASQILHSEAEMSELLKELEYHVEVAFTANPRILDVKQATRNWMNRERDESKPVKLARTTEPSAPKFTTAKIFDLIGRAIETEPTKMAAWLRDVLKVRNADQYTDQEREALLADVKAALAKYNIEDVEYKPAGRRPVAPKTPSDGLPPKFTATKIDALIEREKDQDPFRQASWIQATIANDTRYTAEEVIDLKATIEASLKKHAPLLQAPAPTATPFRTNGARKEPERGAPVYKIPPPKFGKGPRKEIVEPAKKPATPAKPVAKPKADKPEAKPGAVTETRLVTKIVEAKLTEAVAEITAPVEPKAHDPRLVAVASTIGANLDNEDDRKMAEALLKEQDAARSATTHVIDKRTAAKLAKAAQKDAAKRPAPVATQ